MLLGTFLIAKWPISATKKIKKSLVQALTTRNYSSCALSNNDQISILGKAEKFTVTGKISSPEPIQA
jgi:hypothetical protein